MKIVTIWLCLSILIVGCSTSLTTFNNKSTGLSKSVKDDSSFTVFLLERDIPLNIERLGVVTIVNGSVTNVDKGVKEELRRKCQALGANGAYRTLDGFYPRAYTYSYLVFKYKRQNTSSK